jgi:hypothetical protein
MLSPSDTLVAVSFLEDMEVCYPAGFGFSADLLVWLNAFGLPELINCDVKADICGACFGGRSRERFDSQVGADELEGKIFQFLVLSFFWSD